METITIPKQAADQAIQQAREGADLPSVLQTLFGLPAVHDTTIPITERIKTWENVLAWHNTTQAAFDTRCVGDDTDDIGYKMCKMWCSALNEGKRPDYANGSQPKYTVWMEYVEGSGFRFDSCVVIYRRSSFGSRLVLLSDATAKHYGKHAVAEINKFFL